MTDFSADKKKNSQAMNQIIQSLNAVLCGDVAAFRKCIQLFDTMEQKLNDSYKALDKLECKVMQLEDTEKILGKELKSMAETTFEFGRTNEKLLKNMDTRKKLFNEILVNTGCSDFVYGNIYEYVCRKDEPSLIQFGRAQESINKLEEAMPVQSMELSQLALELDKCRMQCLKKNEECAVGVRARKDLEALGTDFRFAARCLDINGVIVKEFLACVELENWLRHFEGYFEENEAAEDEWMNYLGKNRNGEC